MGHYIDIVIYPAIETALEKFKELDEFYSTVDNDIKGIIESLNQILKDKNEHILSETCSIEHIQNIATEIMDFKPLSESEAMTIMTDLKHGIDYISDYDNTEIISVIKKRIESRYPEKSKTYSEPDSNKDDFVKIVRIGVPRNKKKLRKKIKKVLNLMSVDYDNDGSDDNTYNINTSFNNFKQADGFISLLVEHGLDKKIYLETDTWQPDKTILDKTSETVNMDDSEPVKKIDLHRYEIDDLDLLTELYDRFLKQNQLPKMSAEDLLSCSEKDLHTLKKGLTAEQKYYLHCFITIWNNHTDKL